MPVRSAHGVVNRFFMSSDSVPQARLYRDLAEMHSTGQILARRRMCCDTFPCAGPCDRLRG